MSGELRRTNGGGLGQDERELLARINLQIEHCSDYEHKLAKRRAVMREAATMLRLGRGSALVLALIQEQVPDAVITVAERL
jgi:hypothetical protein